MSNSIILRAIVAGVAILTGVKALTLVEVARGSPPWSSAAIGSAQAAAPGTGTASPPSRQAANAPANANPPRGAPPPPAPLPNGPAPPAPAAVDPQPEADAVLAAAARARREALDQRERAIASREAVLVAAERRLSARIEELSTLQTALEAQERSVRERDEASWTALAKLYEGMRPREAAQVLNELDMPVLVELVHRMGGRKAALVLAAMRPERVRQLTVELARLRGVGPGAEPASVSTGR
jgi:flagellar motility protein MotE (MotC chaperone)